MYWISKELTTENSHAAGDEDGNSPFVEEFECKVVNRNLSDPEYCLSGPLDQANSGCHVSSSLSIAKYVFDLSKNKIFF